MGLMQCILCVYLPLWVHNFAPSAQRAKWMGALQSSVPFGVMLGYIIAAVLVGPVSSTDVCFHLLCWRWPLLFEWALLLPFCIAINFVPTQHFATHTPENLASLDATTKAISYDTFSLSPTPSSSLDESGEFKKIDSAIKSQSFATIESKITRQQLSDDSKAPEVK
jgi:MFS family permease